MQNLQNLKPLRMFTVVIMFSLLVFVRQALGVSDSASDLGDLDELLAPIPVDISEGFFAGIWSGFYFMVPDEWLDYEGRPLIVVDRITYEPGHEILDHFNIGFIGDDGSWWQVMRLYVIDRIFWRDDLFPLDVVFRTQSYVFAANIGRVSRHMTPMERGRFYRVWDAVSDVSKIARQIVLAEGQAVEMENTVVADGKTLYSPVAVVNGRVYIPLREAANVLGFEIGWDDDLRKVSVAYEGFLIDHFLLDFENGFNQRYPMRIIDDRVHIVPAYFMGVLRKNVQIDGLSNVIITSR